MRALHLLSVALLLIAAAPATADPGTERDPRDVARDAWELFKEERALENRLLFGQLRGMLRPRPKKADWTPREFEKGRLAKGPGGVPILYIEGTPEEMGRQHGTLLKNEIRGMAAYVRAFVGRRRLAGARVRAKELFLEHCPEAYQREIAALAEAAQLPYEEVLFAQWFTDLYRAFSCTCLAAPSAEGALMARNLDFPTLGFLGRYSVVIVARPTGKRPFVSVTFPGLVGVLSGQSKSLALAVMVVNGTAGARSGLPFQLAFRRVLEESASVDEAEALLRSIPLTVTNNLMLVGSDGTSRGLELHPDGIQARDPNDAGRLVITNHFVTPELRLPRASFTFLSSRKRFDAARKTCPPDGPITVEQGRETLAAASQTFTTQSMIFLPAKGEVEIAFRNRPPSTKAPYVRIPADQLLGE